MSEEVEGMYEEEGSFEDQHETKPKKKRRRKWVWMIPLILIATVALLYFLGDWQYAYTPPTSNLLNPDRGNTDQVYDFWGQPVTQAMADSLLQTDLGNRMLTPAQGAVLIDDELLGLGRSVFYNETFNNEFFFTDILGAMDGPINFWAVTKALISLRGRGTNNLQVKAAHDAVIGGRMVNEGDVINTGIDVAKGAYVPMGMKIRLKQGKPMMGITCAACHSAYDPITEMVVEGAPNNNLNAGLLLAMGTNSASYFANTDIEELESYITENSLRVLGSDGELHYLPDADSLENAVDSTLLLWPPGSFDASNELRATPTRIPDSFTLGDHPYGWTGFAMAGPFRGLSVLNNNVHGLNSDKFADAEEFHRIQGIDREVYVGTLMQNSANEEYRYKPDSEETPIEFFGRNNPTPESPISNSAVTLPSYPMGSFVSPNGLWIGNPGRKVWEEMNAVSAFQNTLIPPPPHERISTSRLIHGRQVFLDAGCQACHSGPAFTNNRVIPVDEIGTEPIRARAFQEKERILVRATGYPFNAEVPVPSATRTIDIPMDLIDQDQLDLSWAINGTDGGYKVKGLRGLYWTAPYLHDGGVAVGTNPETQLGLPGTLYLGNPADPVNSLRALLDSTLRGRVIEANRRMPGLAEVNVQGIGHEFWVDEERGFDEEDMDNLIHYLLHLEWDEEN
ncbi:MAG: hypothetical protein WD267_01700 [Balneolales bacterium]